MIFNKIKLNYFVLDLKPKDADELTLTEDEETKEHIRYLQTVEDDVMNLDIVRRLIKKNKKRKEKKLL